MSWEDLGEVRCQVRGLLGTGFGALCWENGLPPPLCLLGISRSGAWLLGWAQGKGPQPLRLLFGFKLKTNGLSLDRSEVLAEWECWAARLAGRGPLGRAASQPPHRTISTPVSFSRLLRAKALYVEAPRAVPAPASCHFCTFSLGVTIRQLPPSSSQKTPTLFCSEMSVWLLGTQEHLWGAGRVPAASESQGRGWQAWRSWDSSGIAAHQSPDSTGPVLPKEEWL